MVGQRAGFLAEFVFVAAADDQHLHVGEPLRQRGQRAQQHVHALAPFVEAAQEQHGLAGSRIPSQQRRIREAGDVHAVRDLHRVRSQRLHLPAPGQIRHRDAADDLLVERPQDALKH